MSDAPPSKPADSSAKTGISIVLIIVLLGGLFVGMCACLPIGIALLLPAVQAARHEARTMQSMNNVKQIELALINYATVHGSFPPAHTLDESGNPLASWRTMILPFLEQQNLYDQMDLDQPWDVGQNAASADVALEIFRSPHEPNNGLPITNYVAVLGPLPSGEKTAFAPGEQRSIAEFRDGTTHSILIVEILNSDIMWAEPRDLDASSYQRVDEGADYSATNVMPRGGVVGFADGSVQRLGEDTDAQTFKTMLTIGAGD